MGHLLICIILIRRTCQFPRCKYFHDGSFQSTSVMLTGLQNFWKFNTQTSQAYMSWLLAPLAIGWGSQHQRKDTTGGTPVLWAWQVSHILSNPCGWITASLITGLNHPRQMRTLHVWKFWVTLWRSKVQKNLWKVNMVHKLIYCTNAYWVPIV